MMKYIGMVVASLVLLFMAARMFMVACDFLNAPSDGWLVLGILMMGVSALILFAAGNLWYRFVRRVLKNWSTPPVTEQKEKTQ